MRASPHIHAIKADEWGGFIQERRKDKAVIKTITFKPSRTPEVLRNIRLHNRQSQVDVSGLMGLSSISAVSHYENGKRELTLDKLENFSNALGYDVEIRLVRKR